MIYLLNMVIFQFPTSNSQMVGGCGIPVGSIFSERIPCVFFLTNHQLGKQVKKLWQQHVSGLLWTLSLSRSLARTERDSLGPERSRVWVWKMFQAFLSSWACNRRATVGKYDRKIHINKIECVFSGLHWLLMSVFSKKMLCMFIYIYITIYICMYISILFIYVLYVYIYTYEHDDNHMIPG